MFAVVLSNMSFHDPEIALPAGIVTDKGNLSDSDRQNNNIEIVDKFPEHDPEDPYNWPTVSRIMDILT
jgi:hypothetical protein